MNTWSWFPAPHFLGQQSSLGSSTLSLSITSSQHCRKTVMGLLVSGWVSQWGFHGVRFFALDAPTNQLLFVFFGVKLFFQPLRQQHVVSACNEFLLHFFSKQLLPTLWLLLLRSKEAGCTYKNDEGYASKRCLTISDFSHYPWANINHYLWSGEARAMHRKDTWRSVVFPHYLTTLLSESNVGKYGKVEIGEKSYQCRSSLDGIPTGWYKQPGYTFWSSQIQ